MDGFIGLKTATTEELPDAVAANPTGPGAGSSWQP